METERRMTMKTYIFSIEITDHSRVADRTWLEKIKNETSISWMTLQNDNWTLNGMNKKIYIGLKYLFFAFGRNYETL